MRILDFFFPKRCIGCRKMGEYLCPRCFSRISFSTTYLCFACNKPSINGLTHPGCQKTLMIDGIYSSVVYTGIVKKLLYQFKYQPYLTDLKASLGELFYEGIIQHESLMRNINNDCLLVPIPLHYIKKRTRGYNQAEILARFLGQKMGFEVKSLLVRIKKTESQYSLDREKRRQNIRDAFELNEVKGLITGRTVILVDDVVTSGATLIEAGKILKRGGANKVFGITLAHGN